MKIPDIILNSLIKKALGCDANNFKATIMIPNEKPLSPPIEITIIADSVQIHLKNAEKSEK